MQHDFRELNPQNAQSPDLLKKVLVSDSTLNESSNSSCASRPESPRSSPVNNDALKSSPDEDDSVSATPVIHDIKESPLGDATAVVPLERPSSKIIVREDVEAARGSISGSSDNTTLVGEDDNFPEGGLKAWSVVFGSFCGFMASLGIANSIGAFHTQLSKNQLADYSEGTIGWLFSLYAFLTFFCGIYIGPLFDKFGPRYLVASGSVLLVSSMMLIGICSDYWHFILVFGVMGGVGTALLFTPCVAAVGHYFMVRRGTAMGIGQCGGALGGVIFPFLLDGLIPKLGFAWATRILGFVIMVLCMIANLLVRSRLPPSANASVNPDFRILANKKFALTTAGVFLLEWALFVPMTYLSSYAISAGFSPSFAFQLLAIFNAASIFGRWLPGYFADTLGRYNTSMAAVSLSIIACLAVWLPAGGTTAGIVVFALLFGFGSGSNISLTPVCIGQLCKTREYGRYYATCYTIVSLGCLTGIPIAGQIVNSTGGQYWGLIVWTGVCYVGAFCAFAGVRVMAVGWRLREVY